MQYIARRQRICGYIPYRQTQTMGQERRRRRGSVASFWGSFLLVLSFLFMPSCASAIENRKKVKLHNVHGDCTRSLITAQAKAAFFWDPFRCPNPYSLLQSQLHKDIHIPPRRLKKGAKLFQPVHPSQEISHSRTDTIPPSFITALLLQLGITIYGRHSIS